MDFHTNAEELIPSNVISLSGSQVPSPVKDFELTQSSTKGEGALTCAILDILYHNDQGPNPDDDQEVISWSSFLSKIQEGLSKDKQTYSNLMVTSSRPLNDCDNISLYPSTSSGDDEGGTKRAILIGINYLGQPGELSQSHDNVYRMKHFFNTVHGIRDRDIVVLTDDTVFWPWCSNRSPTKENIRNAFQTLVYSSKAGDSAFVYFCGYAGCLSNNDHRRDEEEGASSSRRMTLIPVDFQRVGQMRDTEIYANLIGPMQEGVALTCLMDCCHSGSVIELPYSYVFGNEKEQMKAESTMNDLVLGNLKDTELIRLDSISTNSLRDILAWIFSCIFYLTAFPFTVAFWRAIKPTELAMIISFVTVVILFQIYF